MTLAKYLADYIKHEQEKPRTTLKGFNMEEVIQQGIEAFVSTQKPKLVSINISTRCKCGTLIIVESYK